MEHDRPPSVSRGPRRRRYLAAWLTLLLLICIGYQMSDTPQDIKNLVFPSAFLLGLLGISIWTVRSSGLPCRWRWSVAFAPWLALTGWVSQFEMVNNGDLGMVGWQWRWSPKADELLALPKVPGSDDPIEPSQAGTWQSTEDDYPRFLGSGYWAEVHGVQLQTDWESYPPQPMWHRKIGAGWSGFAVVGSFAITQEQRGENEMVVCYRIDTDDPHGEVVWTHIDQVRFAPGGAGALGFVGPRATPTIDGQNVLTQGATGIVNCLDLRTGQPHWMHDTLLETETENISWGKSGSPLVVNGRAVISVGGENEQSLIAYDIDTGKVAWSVGSRRSSYASPVLTELAGQQQILVVNEDFLTAHRASDGQVLWEYPWLGNSDSNASCSQPVPLAGDRVFLSKGYGIGSTLIRVERDAEGSYRVRPLWSPAVKPIMKTKMGNVLVRDGYAYGLDGVALECLELETGKRQWKRRRRPAFGHGQILLVGEVLLILTEQGQVVLAEVSPKRYKELASLRVFEEEQITWNNPALSGPYLLVRNSEEVACYRLPLLNARETDKNEL
jgi:outer membrane protein assembly factor BamB